MSRLNKDELNIFYDLKTFEKIPIFSEYRFGQCRDVHDFEKLDKIGEGTYGVVYRAKEKKTDEIFALKKIKFFTDKEGLPISTLREINILMNIKHNNVVNLREVVVGSKAEDIYLVMDYCEEDLGSLIDKMSVPFAEPQIKCILWQLFEGMDFLHASKIIHRDMKMTNLLINKDGILKIADFGMSRLYSEGIKKMTPRVVTIWYRAPEVLFGSPVQKFSTDIWSCGCLMAELLLKEPILPGKNEWQQIELIIQLLGTPNKEIWSEIVNMPIYLERNLSNQPFSTLKSKFASFSSACYRLLNSIFVYDPDKRITARKCLQSSYFRESPIPCEPCHIPVIPRKTADSSSSD